VILTGDLNVSNKLLEAKNRKTQFNILNKQKPYFPSFQSW